MNRSLFFLLILCASPAGLSAQESHRHSHTDLFSVTGRIDQDRRDGRLSREAAFRQKALLLRDPARMDAAYRPAPGTVFKCMTPLAAELYRAKAAGQLPPDADALLTGTGTPAPLPATQATWVSPSGKFEFTYFTTGSDAVPSGDNNANAVPDYVEWAGFAADSSWRHMVSRLGYLDPVLSSVTYKMAFKEIGFYGVTYPAGATTRIEIHRNFDGFPSNTHPEGNRKGALLATVGHELKHALQYMYGGWDKNSDIYLEMDATMYEDVTFDDVNDYYNYLPDSRSVFNNPGGSIYGASYYHATWAVFFMEKYGPVFWRQVWQNVGASSTTYMFNIRDAVTARGGSLQLDIIENQLFHAAAGDTVVNAQARALRSFGFEERLRYPTVTSSSAVIQMNSVSPIQSAQITINPLAARHIVVRPQAADTGNVYISLAYNRATNIAGIHGGMGVVVERKDRSHRMYLMPAQANATFSELRLPERWENVRKVIGAIANTDITTVSASSVQSQISVRFEISNRTTIPVNREAEPVRQFALDQNFPNPFNPSTVIRFHLPAAQNVRLDVFDLNGRLVATPYSGRALAGETTVSFSGAGLSSGVYLYRLTSPSGTLVKRLTLLK